MFAIKKELSYPIGYYSVYRSSCGSNKIKVFEIISYGLNVNSPF